MPRINIAKCKHFLTQLGYLNLIYLGSAFLGVALLEIQHASKGTDFYGDYVSLFKSDLGFGLGRLFPYYALVFCSFALSQISNPRLMNIVRPCSLLIPFAVLLISVGTRFENLVLVTLSFGIALLADRFLSRRINLTEA